MRRESHVRFWEGGGVQVPSATRPLVHCRSEAEARSVLEAIRGRLADCGLELHPTKTRIVYCKDGDRPGEYEHVAFDFLGYTFQPRRAKNRWGRYFVSFLPANSPKAATAIRLTVGGWRMIAHHAATSPNVPAPPAKTRTGTLH